MPGFHLLWGPIAKEETAQQLLVKADSFAQGEIQTLNPWENLWLGIHVNSSLNTQVYTPPNGQYTVVVFGEIYNSTDLKRQLLQANVALPTSSTAAIIGELFRQNGKCSLAALEGVFSIVFLDTKEKTLLVARDKRGEIPLYYCEKDGNTILSSSAKSIHDIACTNLDFTQFKNFFYQRFALPGNTFFESIKEWPVGCYSLLLSPDATPSFQDIQTSNYNLHPQAAALNFKSLLQKTVAKHFESNLRVGVMLSGGADSSLLYALWMKEYNEPLHTYTVQVDSKYQAKYSDGPASARVANQIPSFHHLVEVNQQVVLENWEEYIRTVDQPIGDSAGFLIWWVGKEAKKNVDVLVSGAGADELWGGYQRHQAYDFYLKNQRMLLKLKGVLKKFSFNRRIHKFSQAICSDPQHTFFNFSSLMNAPIDVFKSNKVFFNPGLSPYLQGLDFDRRVYLIHDVLKVQENALGAHGLIGRSPYLDEELLGLWRSITDDSYLKGKLWIREYLEELGLGWINGRKKLGFGLPLEEWFVEGGAFATRVYASIREFEQTHGASFPSEMREIARNPESAAKSHFLILYNLFLLGEWVKHHRL